MIGHLETADKTSIDGNYSARFVVEQINLWTAENPKRCNQLLSQQKPSVMNPFGQ